MNNNHKRFHWYVNIHLRSIFKIIFLDVNEKSMKCSIGFVVVLTILSIIEIGSIYTYFNGRELSISPLYAIGIFIGAIEVSIIPTFDARLVA